jgi:dehydrogenase/reductase SDR family protein 1
MTIAAAANTANHNIKQYVLGILPIVLIAISSSLAAAFTVPTIIQQQTKTSRISNTQKYKNSNDKLVYIDNNNTGQRDYKTFLRSSSNPSESVSGESILSYNENSLNGCICVVTGASRGIGKGIALELGAAGATVYITGTTSSNASNIGNSDSKYTTNEDVGGAGTIEQTSNEINQFNGNGKGIPYYCDHSNDDQVKALFDHIESTHGRLDILINNVFRIPKGGTKALFGNFWENESAIESWDAVHTIGLRSHYVATKFAIPIMLQSSPLSKSDLNQPFIGMISSFGGLCYTFNVAYGVGKAGVDRLTKDIAHELDNAKANISVMSFYPGVVKTERTQEAVQNGSWDEDVGIPLENAETPRFTGRAIVAVATDSNNSNDDASNTKKSGSFQVVAELAKEYGFTDEYGNQPPSIRSLKFLLPAYGMDEETRQKVPSWLIPDWKLPFFIMANGAPPPSDDSD